MGAIAISVVVLFVIGCKNNQSAGISKHSLNEEEISLLKGRIKKLENLIINNPQRLVKQRNQPPVNLIKSITLRIGTKDDRLRIYWEDGSNSDLPCTKEQSIWACG